jgi:AraC family carnitine catabolism transcriptional activator
MSVAPILRSPIAFLLVPQFTVIALSSAIEPLRIANRYVARKYEWRLLSLDGRAVPDDNGILIQPDARADAEVFPGTLIVCADIRPERFYDARLGRWLRRLDAAGATLGGLDTGCFLLARAGLLKGCRVTLHWEVIDAFRERFPDVDVHPTLFEIGSRRLSCAGGTAVLDMMLNAIALDHGPAIAHRVAEHCLHERIRSGASLQRMALPMRSGAHHPLLVKALQRLEEGAAAPLSAGPLAGELGISARHLQRLFRTHLGDTPQRYHRRLRLERARALLRQTDLPVVRVGEACGYGSAAQFSRDFRREWGESPGAVRRADAPASRLIMDRGAMDRDGGRK